MSREKTYATEQLRQALNRLRQGAEAAKEELEKDGVIQRFEFTVELFWKTLKILLQEQGVTVRTPREILQEAFRIEWLGEEKLFLDMMEDRNRTSHIYKREMAEEIYQRIKSRYVEALEKAFASLPR